MEDHSLLERNLWQEVDFVFSFAIRTPFWILLCASENQFYHIGPDLQSVFPELITVANICISLHLNYLATIYFNNWFVCTCRWKLIIIVPKKSNWFFVGSWMYIIPIYKMDKIKLAKSRRCSIFVYQYFEYLKNLPCRTIYTSICNILMCILA